MTTNSILIYTQISVKESCSCRRWEQHRDHNWTICRHEEILKHSIPNEIPLQCSGVSDEEEVETCKSLIYDAKKTAGMMYI